MSYDALAESLRLIDEGLPATPARLSRRRRFVPLSVDVDRGLAVTVFVRRTPGGQAEESHVLHHVSGAWRLLGGGGGTAGDDVLADRPRADALGGYVRHGSGGGVRVEQPWWSPGGWSTGRRWASYAGVRVAAEVAVVRVSGRELPVPRHGWVAVVWWGRASPRLEAVAENGEVLVVARLSA